MGHCRALLTHMGVQKSETTAGRAIYGHSWCFAQGHWSHLDQQKGCPSSQFYQWSLLYHIMDGHGLCHWYSQPTLESYVTDTPAHVGQHLDSYIVDRSADTCWAKDLRCIQRTIRYPAVWHSDRPVCIGVYCWSRKLCSVAFQWYNMHPCTFCRSQDMLHLNI